MKNQLLDYAQYNVWANQLIAKILINQDNSILDTEVKSSFPSLRKTVHHIWDAELIWFGRMQGKNLPWPPSEHLFSDPSIDKFVETSKEFAAFVGRVDDFFLNSSTAYKNSKGELFETENTGIIMHCMNHSTFHRGQIVTILRTLGVTDIPSTDLITFLRK